MALLGSGFGGGVGVHNGGGRRYMGGTLVLWVVVWGVDALEGGSGQVVVF